jgi:hypothetical protein
VDVEQLVCVVIYQACAKTPLSLVSFQFLWGSNQGQFFACPAAWRCLGPKGGLSHVPCGELDRRVMGSFDANHSNGLETICVAWNKMPKWATSLHCVPILGAGDQPDEITNQIRVAKPYRFKNATCPIQVLALGELSIVQIME